MKILILNAGSSSVKYKLIDVDNDYRVVFSGLVEAIGEEGSAWRHDDESKQLTIASHHQAMTMLSKKFEKELGQSSIDAIGHRVVHGGTLFSKPTKLTQQVINQLKALTPLAPLHNPANVTCIELAMKQFSTIPHIAIFDTAFHQTMPAKAYQYPIDKKMTEKYAIRRYGFHGTNHQYVANCAANYLNKPLEQCQLISLHLGNGASACLIKQGLSHDTSMGMTPLAGLMMGTRCGDIDPSIVLYLQNQGLSLQVVDALLNKQSGLKAIAGVNDMRQIEALAEKGNEQAKLALSMFCYRIQHYLGAYYAQTPKLDALIFTGGIGENSSTIRAQVLNDMAHLGLTIDSDKNAVRHQDNVVNIANANIHVLVIKGDEEKQMASLIKNKDKKQE